MKKNPLIIFTAVTLEAKAIAQVLHLQKISPTHYTKDEITLHIIGIRGTRIPTPLPLNTTFILAGLAGALSPTLAPGDIIIDAQNPSLSSIQKIAQSPGIHLGPITTAPRLITTPAEKKSLFKTTAALAVEMEAAAVRSALQKISPALFLHIRAISDSASQSLDPLLLTLIDNLGRPKPLALAAALLKHPTLIPQLNQLRKNSQLAAANLARILQNLLAAGWPDS